MAKSYVIREYGHNSIYENTNHGKNYSKRKYDIFFSTPQEGINTDTGIVLFIAGFGANANSNIYKKMREKIADEHNFITIQCNYFGWEFMQTSKKIIVPQIEPSQIQGIFSKEELLQIYNDKKLNFHKLLELGKKYNMEIDVYEDLSDENYDNFNDMGFMQAVDNIGAVLRVMGIIYDNGYKFNASKVFIYGHSHGSYLGYLCNALAPTLFSLLIDNSSWLFPEYLNSNRGTYKIIDNLRLLVKFDYLSKKLDIDRELLYLPKLYSKFKNNCNIISYHGTTDNLISNKDKQEFCLNIDKCIYNEISGKDLDGVIFKSTNHGLDADFIELFKYTILNLDNFNVLIDKNNYFNLDNYITIKTKKNNYLVDYTNILPELKVF